MGGGTFRPMRDERGQFTSLRAQRTYRALRRHPNLVLPAPPADPAPAATVQWACEAVARFISPPKVPRESAEFACQDIAAAIRTQLQPELLRMLASGSL